jgi:hypothetical protein
MAIVLWSLTPAGEPWKYFSIERQRKAGTNALHPVVCFWRCHVRIGILLTLCSRNMWGQFPQRSYSQPRHKKAPEIRFIPRRNSRYGDHRKHSRASYCRTIRGSLQTKYPGARFQKHPAFPDRPPEVRPTARVSREKNGAI